MLHLGRSWPVRPRRAIGPDLTFWFFCVKAKEQKSRTRSAKSASRNAKEHLLPKDHIILTFIYNPAARNRKNLILKPVSSTINFFYHLNQISRRKFLQHSSRLAGGAYPAMMAMGLLKEAPAHPFSLPGDAKGEHIIILGAGLAGLTAAYELQKLGYRCTILEAGKEPADVAGVYARDR